MPSFSMLTTFTMMKETYLDRIRRESSYRSVRSVVTLVSTLAYIVGGLLVAGGILACLLLSSHAISFFNPASDSAVGFGVLFIASILGIVSFAVGLLIRQTYAVLLDVADSLSDVHSRYDQPLDLGDE